MASHTEEEKTKFWRFNYKCVLEQGLHKIATNRMQLQPSVYEASHSVGDDNN